MEIRPWMLFFVSQRLVNGENWINPLYAVLK